MFICVSALHAILLFPLLGTGPPLLWFLFNAVIEVHAFWDINGLPWLDPWVNSCIFIKKQEKVKSIGIWKYGNFVSQYNGTVCNKGDVRVVTALHSSAVYLILCIDVIFMKCVLRLRMNFSLILRMIIVSDVHLQLWYMFIVMLWPFSVTCGSKIGGRNKFTFSK